MPTACQRRHPLPQHDDRQQHRRGRVQRHQHAGQRQQRRVQRQQHRDVGAGVEHRGRHGQPQRQPGRQPQVGAHRRDHDHQHGWPRSGRTPAATAWPPPAPGAISTKFSPNATPEPTVSHATFAVNLCGVTSSSVASRLTSTTAINASTTPTRRDRPRPLPDRQADTDGHRGDQNRRQRRHHRDRARRPTRRRTTTRRTPARRRTAHPRTSPRP